MTIDQLTEKLHLQRVVDEREAAAMAGISVSHLRRLRKSRTGPRYIALGQRRLGYQVADLLAWIDGRRSSDAADAPSSRAA